ncbi:EAL domain-containing protein [Vibrio sp. JPW-9-11-11]|uniref:PTS sugar transporter subunit IIC/EAL domain-containing protein n=1 Tax=Vibrio sp. JPW-9-11-11 TaxID=1416532 RepID=UPI001594785B|nr:EAL domain-containing protein [Vibrio sp. JPW-9-11-11]NVD06436.1 EAL domain-containing protein [Vibrio sp. JPW-9-11-11]
METSSRQRASTVLSTWFVKFVFPSFQAIREGMVWLIPCLMISSFCLLLACLGEFFVGYRTGWVNALYELHQGIALFFPYLMTATISYVLAMQWRLPRPPIALLSILYLILVARLMPEEQTVLTFQIIMAILTPLYAIPVLAHLLRYSTLQLTKIDSAGHIVKESLNLVMPAVITSALVVTINLLLFSGISDLSLLSLMHVDYANSPTLFGMTFSVLNSLFWFIGVHGYYALLPLVDLLQEASNLNYSTVLAGGEGVYPMNLSFMGAFVFIGGSGATLSLVVALLLFTKQKSLKLIALASIPIGLLNINEILLFGLPIILNPRLFVPFLLAPMANVIISMMAVSQGWVVSPSVSVPFNSPIFFNALVATDGDIAAVLLQAFNVLVGVVIYYPAVKAIGHSHDKQAIHITALDTSFSRLQEEAQTLSDDPVVELARKTRENRAIEREMELLSRRDFCLEYQPQVSPSNQQVVGCEALIRAINDKGDKLQPYQFLPWLEKAGLMKELDLWVVKQAVSDVEKMQTQGVFINVSVNITPDTLLDEESLTKLEAMIEPYAHYVDIEITEETLLADTQRLTLALNRLHQLGVKFHIDDFGTGYSSLSYLNQFDIDCIKIDRSFVLALDSEKGRRVFKTLLAIADQLAMEVIVEGVETEQQLAHIPRSSSVTVQGWYYAKAMPIEALINYCNRSAS